jgi:hypothetical protein
MEVGQPLMLRHFLRSLRRCSNITELPAKSVPLSIRKQHDTDLMVNHKDLLLSLDTLVRVVLTRLQVDRESVSQLLIATVGLRRKNQPQDPTSIVITILPTIFEILNDGLRLKTRIQSNTLQSMLEVEFSMHSGLVI